MPDGRATSNRVRDFNPGDSVTMPYYTANVSGWVTRVGRVYVYVRWVDGWGQWEGRYRPEELRHG